MAETREYKCPCCDGAIAFDSDSQKLKCPYCATEFDVDVLSSYDEELKCDTEDKMEWETEAGGQWQQGEEETLKVYTCNSCGGELVGDENTAATSCPYCENPIVLTGRLSGVLKPDCVIPFKLDKKDAVNALKRHYKGKPLLPKVFKDQNHIEEIKGIYVPFWLFDAEADAHIRYRATTLRVWSDSNYNYKETCYYSVTRGGNITFERVPVDGSSKINDDLMESIEPYDFKDAVDFKTAYLAGFFADKYDVDASSCIEQANVRIKNSTEAAFADTVRGYTTVTPVSSGVQLNNGSAKYALYPVWLLTTKWRGETFTFAMNGQTGRFAGDLPIDKKAYMKWLFGLTAAVGAISFLISYLIWLF